jgi:hypothetical protein
MKMSFNKLVMAATVFAGTTLSAQDADTTLGWTNEITGGLSLTQAAFDNWQQGGENLFAWQALLNSRATHLTPDWKWQNSGRFNIGFNKVGDQGNRKSLDEIKLESVLTRLMGKYLNPFVAFKFRSQFASGFIYNADGSKTKVAKFMDPGYFTESAGLGYSWKRDPVAKFESRLGGALKQTVTSDFPVYADDPATAKIEKTRNEIGLSWVSELGLQLHQNIHFNSQLDLFQNFEGLNETDILWENLLTMTVTKYINVTFNVDLLYDRDVSVRRQIRQQMAVGFTYTFL